MTDAVLIEIFCIIDEYLNYLESELRRHTIQSYPEKVHRNLESVVRY